MWILRRTRASLDMPLEPGHLEQLRDPHSVGDNQPAYARDAYRSLRDDIFVAIGLCTHLGCVPVYLAEENAPGGQALYFCLCHGSRIDLAGRGIVLNFWATRCPPCRREMPMLDEFHADYRARELSVIGLAIDEPLDQVRHSVESIGASYPVWVDAPRSRTQFNRSKEVFNRYGGVGLPMTVFIDRGSVIRRIYIGELSRGFLQGQAEII